MAMDSTVQIRMNNEVKTQVEALYRGLGTSFAEAVRIFAQQSLREGGLPFRPSLKTWEEMTDAEIDAKLMKSEKDLATGAVYTQNDLDSMMMERFGHGRESAI